MAKAVPENLDLLVCMPSELEKIKALAERLSIEDIMHKLEILQSCNERIARVSSKRVEMEMCLIKLCTAQNPASGGGTANTELLAKIDMLEQRIAAQPIQSGRAVQTEQAVQPAQTAQPSKPQYAPKQQAETGDLSKMKPEDFVNEDRWQDILEKFAEICPSVNGALNGSYAVKGGGYMLIYTENSFFLQLLRNKENAAKLQEAIKLVTGNVFSIRAKCVAPAESGGDKLQGVLQKARDNNIPVDSEGGQ